MIIIGSRSFNAYFPNIVQPKDLDLIGSEQEILKFFEARGDDVSDITRKSHNGVDYKITAKSKEYGLIECELYNQYKSSGGYCHYLKTIGEYCIDEQISGFTFQCANPEVQYSIKLGHIFHPVNWHKHIKQFDILHQYVRGIDILREITLQRKKETTEILGRLKTPSLKTASKDTFFKDSVEKIRVFEHDEIHRLVAFEHDTPAFTKMQPDPKAVSCAKDMWLKMTFEEQCNCVIEEAYAIALERIIIPMIFIKNRSSTPEEAYRHALMRISTTLCSGWFREFALFNHAHILKRGLSIDYVGNFMERYEAGDIKHIDTYKKYQTA